MPKNIDKEKTVEIIERLKIARIGEYKKWELIVKKITEDTPLSTNELEYFANITRIYKESKITSRTKIYHTKLSKEDHKPTCQLCENISDYYCNMNDQYFCTIHVVGHDENEI